MKSPTEQPQVSGRWRVTMSDDNSPVAPDRFTRRHPHHEVIDKDGAPTIVFITVCTSGRVPWLANPEVHDCLVWIWRQATAWFVGRYVLMPDHVHMFASPGTPELPLKNWVTYWKSLFSKRHQDRAHRWQSDYWDTTLRGVDRYEEKWNYALNNPVRKGLVANASDWPFQGEVFELRWR